MQSAQSLLEEEEQASADPTMAPLDNFMGIISQEATQLADKNGGMLLVQGGNLSVETFVGNLTQMCVRGDTKGATEYCMHAGLKGLFR